MRKSRIAVLLMAFAALGYGAVFAWNSEPLKLRTVEVGGNHAVTKESVAAVSGLEPGAHLLSISIASVKSRVESISWVRNARVERILPSKIRITVTERTPAAQISLRAASFVADEEGVVLAEGSHDGLLISGLPIEALVPGDRITAPQYRHCIEITKQLDRSLRERLVRIKAPTIDGITLEFADGTKVLYGAAESMSEKNFAIEALLQEAANEGAGISSIDVRVPRRPAVRPR